MGKNETVPNKEAHMTSIAASAVSIQTSSQSVPWAPCWLGEVTLVVQHLRQQGVLDAIPQQVRFARRRFGHYEVIDFLAVLFGYAISGERTLEADLTSGWLPGQRPSWRSSTEIGCQLARRSRAFWGL
jgi:hypothetical protein